MKYKVKPNLNRKPKEFPLKNKKMYEKANSYADDIEKKKTPRGYKKLKKLDKKLKSNEIMGHIDKSGKAFVSKKVPKSLRKEVVDHDKNERKYILKHSKTKRRK